MGNDTVHIETTAHEQTLAKTKMREQALARRDAMTPEQRAIASHEICKQLKRVAGTVLDCRKVCELDGTLESANANEQCKSEDDSNRVNRIDGHGANIPCVAVYTPMKSEVDVSEFIAWLYQRKARVAFPCMNKKGVLPRMHMREVGRAAWDAS